MTPWLRGHCRLSAKAGFGIVRAGRVLDDGRQAAPQGPAASVRAVGGGAALSSAGCGAPTHWCDVHRVLEWHVDQGDPSLENSALFCERHHTQVHHGFRIERDPDGR